MPLVVVGKNPEVVTDEILKKLVRDLPGMVAKTLGCDDPGGDLTPQDIEVWVQDFGPHDINTKDVEIIIWANFYLGRAKNLSLRRRLLGRLIRDTLPREIKGFVWVLLNPASFGEF
jgi:hypothetical protein